MSWELHIQAALVDLTAALTCNNDTAIDHITDAEVNLERAKEAWEKEDEGTLE